VKVVTIFTL